MGQPTCSTRTWPKELGTNSAWRHDERLVRLPAGQRPINVEAKIQACRDHVTKSAVAAAGHHALAMAVDRDPGTPPGERGKLVAHVDGVLGGHAFLLTRWLTLTPSQPEHLGVDEALVRAANDLSSGGWARKHRADEGDVEGAVLGPA